MGSREELYKTWERLIAQCNDPLHPYYSKYGAKGIDVCKRWKKDFENFFLDMGIRPSRKHLLFRKDIKRNFSKSNCRWETTAQRNQLQKQKKETKGYVFYKGLYRARIRVDGKKFDLGGFNNPQDAHNKYLEAKKEAKK